MSRPPSERRDEVDREDGQGFRKQFWKVAVPRVFLPASSNTTYYMVNEHRVKDTKEGG